MDRPILIVDNMNVFIRHYCANPAMDSDGETIGGVIGYIKSLASLIRKLNPKKIITVWESGGSPRRRKIFPEYKQGRKPLNVNRYYGDIITEQNSDENKYQQIYVLTKLLKRLPIYQIHVPDCEADDIIGYLCKLRYPNEEKVIYSSDKDFYQLLNDKTKIYSPGKMIFVTKADVEKEYSITPENFCVAKAFCGDNSDNIPGIDGVGFKTLAKRFVLNDQKVTVDDLILLSEERKKDKKHLKIYDNISDGVDTVKRNYDLMRLDSSLMSSDQVSTINRILDEYVLKVKKLEFIRVSLEHKISGETLNPDVIYDIFGYLIY